MTKKKTSAKNSTAKIVALAAAMKRMSTGKQKSKKKTRKRTTARMGAVSAISTAPVAIGNSIRGARSQSRRTPGGIVVSGRDFMFTPIGTGSISTWTSTGGTPLTPVAFGDSCVRQYMQMYQKYRWLRCVVHYITSSPTSSTGDVMFYHAKNRDSVFLNQTSSFLLPFVISDPDTVIGPQWTNHSADLEVQGTWKSTDYGMTDALNDYADGEVFLLSKTTTTDSPGYVLFDYAIEFAEMQITPRLLSLPLPRAQYNNANIGVTALATVSVVTRFYGVPVGNGLNGSGSQFPPGFTQGDIYKVVFDITNSSPGSWVTATVANLIAINNGSTAAGDASVTVADGFTCYGVIDSSSKIYFFPNSAAAYAGSNGFVFNVTGTTTYNVQMWLSLVGSLNSTNLLPNF